ncbi:MAG: aminoglycoside phosphotransferase [Acidimicrobiales bacterium]|nr:aminoglycoside phosphotransferase [Acidimicrobiales bacterium]
MFDDDLLRILTEHLGAQLAFSSPPVPLSGGFWAAIWSFQITGGPSAWDGPLVLRVMPDAVVARREIAVQRAVGELGFRTPRVLFDGEDDALGGAFMVMTKAAGTTPLGGLDLGISGLVGLPRTLRRLPRQLAWVAAELHALAVGPVAEAFAASGGVPGTDLRRHQIRAAAQTAADGFDALDRWFDDHTPAMDPRVASHGDLHPFNLLVDGGNDGAHDGAHDGDVTVLDWTNANLLPAEFDLGCTAGLLRCAPIAAPCLLRPVIRRLTAWLAESFVRRYEAARPEWSLDPAALAWFEALQHGRCLAEVVSARRGLSNIVGASHPFETSADSMLDRTFRLTGVRLRLPPRPAPAG